MPKLSNALHSKREQAYLSLRRLLVLQQIQPGQRIREPEWAKRLDVNRSALREAFARLEAEGLIVRGAQTGYFVPQITPQDVLEITQLRLTLECLAIERICLAKPQPSLKPMRRAVDELQRFLEGGYSLGVLEADRRFHEALIDLAGMKRLSALYHRAPLPMLHKQTENPEIWRELSKRTLREHQLIISAIEKRQASQSKRILQKHLTHRSMMPICQ